MKLLQLLDMSLVGSPSFAAVEQSTQDHSPVHSNFGGNLNAVFLPESLCQSAKCSTSLRNAHHHLCIKRSVAADGATKVAELADGFDVSIVDDNR